MQAISGGGGWPLSVFLTPDLKPITGGTYFPPRDMYGRPGFVTFLNMIAEKVCQLVPFVEHWFLIFLEFFGLLVLYKGV